MKLPSFSQFFKKQPATDARVRPAHDWFLMLSGALTLVALSVGWNVWMYEQVQNKAIETDGTHSAAFNAAPIESVRAVFDARKAEEARFKSEYRFVDPSR